jgi:hypothetical protein
MLILRLKFGTPPSRLNDCWVLVLVEVGASESRVWWEAAGDLRGGSAF